MTNEQLTLLAIRSKLEKIKKPRIRESFEDEIEEEVGDSVEDAYAIGKRHGRLTERYELAQKVLNKISKRPRSVTHSTPLS